MNFQYLLSHREGKIGKIFQEEPSWHTILFPDCSNSTGFVTKSWQASETPQEHIVACLSIDPGPVIVIQKKKRLLYNHVISPNNGNKIPDQDKQDISSLIKPLWQRVRMQQTGNKRCIVCRILISRHTS